MTNVKVKAKELKKFAELKDAYTILRINVENYRDDVQAIALSNADFKRYEKKVSKKAKENMEIYGRTMLWWRGIPVIKIDT